MKQIDGDSDEEENPIDQQEGQEEVVEVDEMDSDVDEDDDDDDMSERSSQQIDMDMIQEQDNEEFNYLQQDLGENEYGSDDSDEDSEDEQYLQKFDKELRKKIVQDYHPELIIHSNEDIQAYTKIIKNEQGIIVDPLHTTLPFITKYEKARILGERAKQINAGAKPLVKIDKDIIDGYLIALKEFEEKHIPFIIKRPLPNGGCEYWKCKDLEII
jgi:DNA-directed RNA polymerase I, II, and III subunit RPABC2